MLKAHLFHYCFVEVGDQEDPDAVKLSDGGDVRRFVASEHKIFPDLGQHFTRGLAEHPLLEDRRAETLFRGGAEDNRPSVFDRVFSVVERLLSLIEVDVLRETAG